MKRFLIIIVLLLSIDQIIKAEFLSSRNETIYFELDDLKRMIPYEKWSQTPFELNDSIVCDVRYKKLLKRLSIVTFKKEAYYSTGYAAPLSIAKYKVDKPRLDTALMENESAGEKIPTIRKIYKPILIKKEIYFK